MQMFFMKTKHESKWKREDIEQLANKIGLDFKSVNKWLWDRKNKTMLKELKERDYIWYSSLEPKS